MPPISVAARAVTRRRMNKTVATRLRTPSRNNTEKMSM